MLIARTILSSVAIHQIRIIVIKRVNINKENAMPFAIAQDGARIAYNVSGTGEPLLFVSGQSLDRHMWDNFASALINKYKVITYDYRGTGESDKPQDRTYSTELFADDAVAVMDAAGVGQVHAFGFSMGGRVCQWLGVKHQSRIATLILGATTPGNKHGFAREESVSRLLVTGDLVAMQDLFYSREYVAAGGYTLPSPTTPDFAKKLHFMASENHDVWNLLPTIQCPALIIHGSNDRINRTENAYLLNQAIPNASVAIVEGGRHGFIDEYKEEVCKLLNNFIERHSINS